MADPDPQQESKRIGQGMIAAGFVLALVMLTAMFGHFERKAVNPNGSPESMLTSTGITEVYLQRNRAGHYLLSGFINSVAADFILDTGATDVVIPEALAARAGLEYGYAAQAMTANGVIRVYNTSIGSLELGAITLHDVRASINPSMPDGTVLLGMSALRQIEFHQQGNQLTLRYTPDLL